MRTRVGRGRDARRPPTRGRAPDGRRAGDAGRGRAEEPAGARVRPALGGADRGGAGRGGQRSRRRPADPGGTSRRRTRAGRRGAVLLAQLRQGHRTLRGTHHRRDQQPRRSRRLQQLAPRRRDEGAARRPHARRIGRQDHVRRPVPDGTAGLAAGALRRRCRAHRHAHRRAAHDPDGAGRGRARRQPRRSEQLRARRARDRRSGEPRAGHRRRPALFRHRRRRADDPALRLVLRRQRAARQDRARLAAGVLRRLGIGRVPRRAVHADRHRGQADRHVLPRLRRLPERVRQDQPGHDAAARRPWRPVSRHLLRRRHRLALGRSARRPPLRDEPRVRRLRRRQGHQREDQPDRAAIGGRGQPGDLHQRRLQRHHPRGVVGGQVALAARRPRRLARLDRRGDRRSSALAATSRGRTRTAGSPRR